LEQDRTKLLAELAEVESKVIDIQVKLAESVQNGDTAQVTLIEEKVSVGHLVST